MLGNSVVTRQIGDEEIRFGKLTPRDRYTILERLRSKRRDDLLRNLRTVEADKGEMLAELAQFDETEIGEDDWIKHVNSLEGRQEVITAALQKQYGEKSKEEADKLPMNFNEIELVAELCGLELVTKTPKQAEDADATYGTGDEKSPDPTDPPATYSIPT